MPKGRRGNPKGFSRSFLPSSASCGGCSGETGPRIGSAVDRCREGQHTQEGAYALRDFAKPFYSSTAWENTRRSYIKSVGGLCERCLAKGIYRAGVIVHHKVHLSPENINDPDVTLNWNNLELLCRDCHGAEHEKIRRRYTVDEQGRITAR